MAPGSAAAIALAKMLQILVHLNLAQPFDPHPFAAGAAARARRTSFLPSRTPAGDL